MFRQLLVALSDTFGSNPIVEYLFDGVSIDTIVILLIIYSIFLALAIVYYAWKSTGRRPLNYDLFLVEMHTMTNRRLVEVLHIADTVNPRQSYSEVIQRMRNRARNNQTEGGRWLAVGDTNVVVQSPSTTLGAGDSPVRDLPIYEDRLMLWEIELPVNINGIIDTERDSQIAVAVAFSVLGRQPVELSLNGQDDMTPPTIRVPPHRASVMQIGNVVTHHRTSTTSVELAMSSPQEDNYQQSTLSQQPNNDRSTQEETSREESSDPPALVEEVVVEPVSPSEPEQAPVGDVSSEATDSPPTDGWGIDDKVDENQMTVRLKFLDDTTKDALISHDDSVTTFLRKNFREVLAEGKVVRLIYNGQLLRDNTRTFQSYGIKEGSVIHCNISNRPYATTNGPVQRRPRRATPVPDESDAPSMNDSQNAIQQPAQNREEIRHAVQNDSLARLLTDYMVSDNSAFQRNLLLWYRRVIRNHEEMIRPSGNNNVFSRLYQRLHATLFVPFLPIEEQIDYLEQAAEAAAAASRSTVSYSIGDFLMWIFGFQCVAVWGFFYLFPQLRDSVAIGLLVLLTLYFVFVVYRNQQTPVPADQNTARTSTT